MRFLFTICLCFFLLGMSSQESIALDVTKYNLSYRYNLNDVLQFKHRVAQQGDMVEVYYEISGQSIAQWDQTFLLQNSYTSSGHDTLRTTSIDTLSYSSSTIMIKLTLPDPGANLLLITFSDYDRGQYRLFDVPVKSPLGFPPIVPVNQEGLPILDSYVNDENIQFLDERQYSVFAYEDDFDAADPAMGMMQAIAPTLEIDSTFTTVNGLKGMEMYHFYLIQQDSLSDNGVTLLRTPSYYPEFKRLEELVGPLTYITTPNEKKMLNDEMTKQSFENFWLNTYTSKLRAKSAIKRYYDEVEIANRLFTSYKSGWKTDPGMIYIIFGQPPIVVRSDRTEIWKYSDQIEFEFIRISTLFTPSLYSLKRNKKYEQIWYDIVGNIRKGL